MTENEKITIEEPKEIRVLADKIIRILDARKAVDIKLLRVSSKTVIADYFIICNGTSTTQVRGLCDEVEFRLGEEGVKPAGTEGLDTCLWGVMDFSSVILHVFNADTRKYYNLEKLWAEAEEIDISDILTQD